MDEKHPLSVAVLMGGESRRFGSPKAFLSCGGSSLASSLLGKASSFSDDVFAVVRSPSQVPPDARERFAWTLDIEGREGPVSGLQAALGRARHRAVFLTAVDMPFLERAVVEGLWGLWDRSGRPDVVAPRLGGRWEPMCALWAKECGEVLEKGDWDSFQTLLSGKALKVREVSAPELSAFDPSLGCLRNFNTREEWLERMPGSQGGIP